MFHPRQIQFLAWSVLLSLFRTKPCFTSPSVQFMHTPWMKPNVLFSLIPTQSFRERDQVHFILRTWLKITDLRARDGVIASIATQHYEQKMCTWFIFFGHSHHLFSGSIWDKIVDDDDGANSMFKSASAASPVRSWREFEENVRHLSSGTWFFSSSSVILSKK